MAISQSFFELIHMVDAVLVVFLFSKDLKLRTVKLFLGHLCSALRHQSLRQENVKLLGGMTGIPLPVKIMLGPILADYQ